MSGTSPRSSGQHVDRTMLSRREFAAAAAALGVSATTARAARAEPASPAPADRADDVNGTFPLTEETVTLRVLIASNPAVEDFTTNTFTQWYEEKTNVHIEWEVVPLAEAQTGLNVRLASGDLPDIIMGFEATPRGLPPSLQVLYGTRRVHSLNALIEEHGVGQARLRPIPALARGSHRTGRAASSPCPQSTGCHHVSYPKSSAYQPGSMSWAGVPTTTAEFEQVFKRSRSATRTGNGWPTKFP